MAHKTDINKRIANLRKAANKSQNIDLLRALNYCIARVDCFGNSSTLTRHKLAIKKLNSVGF